MRMNQTFLHDNPALMSSSITPDKAHQSAKKKKKKNTVLGNSATPAAVIFRAEKWNSKYVSQQKFGISVHSLYYLFCGEHNHHSVFNGIQYTSNLKIILSYQWVICAMQMFIQQ